MRVLYNIGNKITELVEQLIIPVSSEHYNFAYIPTRLIKFSRLDDQGIIRKSHFINVIFSKINNTLETLTRIAKIMHISKLI